MAEIAKEIVAKLSLDSKEFKNQIGDSGKDVVKLTASITAAAAAIMYMTGEVANYNDKIIKAARATGTTTEEMSSLSRAAEMSGVSFDDLRGSLLKLTPASQTNIDNLKKFGISMSDATGKAKTQTELLGELGDKFNKLKTPQEKAAAATMVFGEQGAKLGSLLQSGTAGLKAFAEETEKLGLTISEKAGLNAEKFNDDMKRLKDSIFGTMNVVGQSIIEFLNQGEIMDKVRSAIQSVTKWWSNLSDSTKNTIIRVGAIVTAIAAVTLALMGIIAIAPAVGGAWTIMFGPIGLVIAGLAAVTYAIIEFWDQIKFTIMPAVELLQDFFNDIKSTIIAVATAISDFFSKFSEGADDGKEKISIFGTIVNVVMKSVTSSFILAVTPLKIMFTILKNLIQAFITFGTAAYKAITLDFSGAAEEAKKGFAQLGNTVTDVVDEVKLAGDKFKKIWIDAPYVIKKTEDQTKKLGATTKDLTKTFDKLPQTAKAAFKDVSIDPFNEAILKLRNAFADSGKIIDAQIADLKQKLAAAKTEVEKNEIKVKIQILQQQKVTKELDSIFNMIDQGAGKAQVVIGAFSQLAQAEVEKLAQAQKILERDFQVRLAQFQKQAELEKSTLEKSYNDQIDAIKNAEDQKTAIIKQAAAERMLAMNEEYLAAKALEEQRYRDFVASETLRYETEKEMLLQRAYDKEQRQLTETLMDEDFRRYLESLEKSHTDNLSELQKSFNAKQKEEGDKAKADEEKSTIDKNNALALLEDEKNKKLEELDAKHKAEEDRLRKEQAQAVWDSQVAQYNATKATKIAETVTSGIAAASQAFAALAPIPFVGIGLGLAAAAIITGATAQRVSQIQTTSPMKPAELMMESGGVLGGNRRHSVGGVNANLESGEAVIDRARTEKIVSFVDGMTSSGGFTFIFNAGAIQTGDRLLDERTVEVFSQRVAQRIERMGAR